MGYPTLKQKQYTSISLPNHDLIVPKQRSFLKYLFSRHSILARLLFSLLPPLGSVQAISTDYEGSVLSVFLLSCVLYNRFSKLGIPNQLISAVFIPILYISVFSGMIGVIKTCTKTSISLREVICCTCYGLFGHTVTLALSILSSKLFLPSLIIFAGLSSVRICGLLLIRTRLPPLRFVVCTPAMVVHLLFLVYLHVVSTA